MRSAGFLAVLVALVAAAVVFAETQSYVQVMDNGKVDWIRGKGYVVGEGVPLRDAVGGQKRTTARIAARQLALREADGVIAGIAVSSETETVDSALSSDRIRSAVRAHIKAGPTYTDSRHPLMQALGFTDLGWNAEEEVFRLVMEIPLAGAQTSVNAAVLPPVLSSPPTKPDAPTQYSDVPALGSRETPPDGPATGLIVDCTQAEVEPALAPKIYNRETKQEIYGGAAVDTDTAVKRGIVGYVTSLADAKKAVDRVGQRPMVVPAAAAVGTRAVALTGDDAEAVLAADRESSFLKQCRVMFVLKP